MRRWGCRLVSMLGEVSVTMGSRLQALAEEEGSRVLVEGCSDDAKDGLARIVPMK
jgi:hypothetical protein